VNSRISGDAAPQGKKPGQSFAGTHINNLLTLACQAHQQVAALRKSLSKSGLQKKRNLTERDGVYPDDAAC
jgi:hypothetical protein